MRVQVIVRQTSWPVSVVWCLVTSFVVLSSAISLMESDWWVNRSRGIGFGPLFYRVGFGYAENCVFCEYPVQPGWSLRHITAVSYGIGVMLFAFSSVASVTHLLLPDLPAKKEILDKTAFVQIIAGLLQMSGLLIYPTHLDSHWGRYFCGDFAKSFSPENCELGWAYMLAIVACAISLYCPVLAKLSLYTHNIEDVPLARLL